MRLLIRMFLGDAVPPAIVAGIVVSILGFLGLEWSTASLGGAAIWFVGVLWMQDRRFARERRG